MRVTMNVTISGPRPGGADWPARGETLDTNEDEARSLIAGGLAVEGNAQAPEPEAGATAAQATDGEPKDEPRPAPKRAAKKAAARKG